MRKIEVCKINTKGLKGRNPKPAVNLKTGKFSSVCLFRVIPFSENSLLHFWDVESFMMHQFLLEFMAHHMGTPPDNYNAGY